MNQMLQPFAKNIKFFGQVAQAVVLKKQYPFSASFITTHRCNFNCSYCNSPNIREGEMTTEQIYEMIDELAEMGLQRIGFTGGEPLLFRDIGKIISHAKAKGIMTSMVTNGSLLKNKFAEIKDLDLILLSLDGPKEIHEAVREKGVYEVTIDAIKLALASGKQVWTQTVISKANLTQLDFVIDVAEELGFRCLFQPVFNYPLAADKKTIDQMIPDNLEYQKAINHLMERKKQGAPIVGSYSYFEYIRDNYPDKIYPNCKAGFLFCAISPSGIVAPCHFLIKEKGRDWKSGIEEGSFKKAFLHIKDNTCNGCFCNSYMETNLLFSLNAEATWNAAKTFWELRK